MSGATSPEAETIIRQTETINRLMGDSASRINRVQAELDKTWAAQTRYERALSSINAAMERGRISQERANQLIGLASQNYDRAKAAAERFNLANDNAARGSRNFGQVIGQAGFQVNDFAVQVASGQSALTAFVQQGSQILGVFGPGGAVAAAALAIAGIGLQLMGSKSATEALNEAVERQRDLYAATTEAAERYREAQEREALSAQRLTAYYATLSDEMKQAERQRLSMARNDLLQTQRDRVTEATSRLGGLTTGVPGMPFAESMMSSIGGPGSLPAGLRDAAEAVRLFREQGVFTAEAIDTLSNRLLALAQANVGSSAAIMRQRQELEAARPQLIEAQRALEQNAAANAALEGNARSAAQALGGVGAAAQAQLQPLRDLVRDLDKVNAELAALRSGGLEGLEQQRRSQTIMERAQRDLDQDVAERVRRGASPSDARSQALDSASMADRIGEATRLVEAQRQVTETTERLQREQREREAAARRSGGGRAATPQANDALREREALLQRNMTAEERYAQGMERLADLQDRLRAQDPNSVLPDDVVQREAVRLMEEYERATQRADGATRDAAEGTKEWERAAQSVGKALASAFEDLVFEGRTFSDVLKGLERDLLRIGNQMLLQPLFQQGFNALLGGGSGGGAGGGMGGAGGIIGSLASNIFGSGGGSEIVSAGAGLLKTATSTMLFHDGGVVGEGGRRGPLLPAEVFLDAPRYHSGAVAGGMPFANDEVPAVLKRREVVLTEGQQAAVRRQMGGVTVVNNIHTPDADSFRRSGGQIGADMARKTQRALARNG